MLFLYRNVSVQRSRSRFGCALSLNDPNTNSGFSFGFWFFFAHATIAHTERKSYIEKSQWTDTNHQVQYHSHAVHMNDKTTASWLFVSLFFVCYGCYYDYFEPADWAHSEIQNTKPYLYGSPCYTVRLPYFLLTYATYICVGSFVFQRANWFMWPVIRSTFV